MKKGAPFRAPSFFAAVSAQRAPLPDPPEPPDDPEPPEEPVPRELEELDEPDVPDEPDDPLIPPLEPELPELPDMPPLELELPDEPLSESADLLPPDAERSLPLDAERSLLGLPASPSPCDDDPLGLEEPLMPPLLLLDEPEVFWSRSAMCFLLFPCGRFAGAGAQIPPRAPPFVPSVCA